MTLVLGLQLYHGRFNKNKNKYFQMCSLRFHLLNFKLNFGALRGFQKIEKNHEDGLFLLLLLLLHTSNFWMQRWPVCVEKDKEEYILLLLLLLHLILHLHLLLHLLLRLHSTTPLTFQTTWVHRTMCSCFSHKTMSKGRIELANLGHQPAH